MNSYQNTEITSRKRKRNLSSKKTKLFHLMRKLDRKNLMPQ